MQAEVFVNRLYDEAQKRKLEQFQISYNYVLKDSLKVDEGEVKEESNSENQTVSFAVKINGKIGRFACSDLDEKNIKEIVDQAVETAELINEDEENFFHDGSGKYKKACAYRPLEKIKTLDRLAFLREVGEAAKKADKRIAKVADLEFRSEKRKEFLRNSLGLDVSEENESAFVYVEVKAEEKGVVKTAEEVVFFDKPEDFFADKLGQQVAKKVISQLDEVGVKSGIMPVVFENRRFPDFLNFLSIACSAYEIQNERSKLAGKLNKPIASKILTVIENPHLDGGYATASFDGEGYPTIYKEVIKDGILQTYLHNLKTAHKDGVEPTGNGSGVSTCVSNFYVKPGTDSKENILLASGTGVYVTDLNGLHAGMSMVSGDFSFGAGGFLIENGKLGKALKQITISGNFYQMLKDIRKIGNDLEFYGSGCGSPSVLIDGLMIASD